MSPGYTSEPCGTVETTWRAGHVHREGKHDMTDTTGPPAAGWKDDPGATTTSGAPWWLVAVMGVVTLVIGVAIGAVASGGNADDTVTAPATSADETPASEEPSSDETTSAEPTPDASGGAGSATDPLAIDTPWAYDTSYFGEDATQWEGTFEGLVSLPVHEWEEDQDARCFAVIGTMSPTSIADGAFTNNAFDTPEIEVVIGGKVEGEFGLCDTDALDAAGYGATWDAEVSVGTDYKFYDQIYLPSTVTGDVELIVLGSASDGDAVFYQPTPATVG